MRGWFFYYKHQAPGHALFTTLCCNITLPLAPMGRDLTSCSLFMSVTHPLVPKVSMSLGTLQIIKWSTLSSTHSLWVHCPTGVAVWSPHHSAQGLAWKALSPSWNPWPPGEGAWKDKCSTFQFSIIRKRHWGRRKGRKRENLSEVFFTRFTKASSLCSKILFQSYLTSLLCPVSHAVVLPNWDDLSQILSWQTPIHPWRPCSNNPSSLKPSLPLCLTIVHAQQVVPSIWPHLHHCWNPTDRGAWRATVHGVTKESDRT